MTRPALSPPARYRPFATAMWLGALAMQAFVTSAAAQGTAEQREACTADAVRLCYDTIPDVERTTACMKRHEAELSRRCHRVFAAEERKAPDARRRRVGRIAPPPDAYDEPSRVQRLPPPDDDDEPRRVEGLPPRDDYDEPRHGERLPPPDDYDPRRVERVPPFPYDDGLGPRRYLYLTPRGLEIETPPDE